MRIAIVSTLLLAAACSGQTLGSELTPTESPLVTYGTRDDDAGRAPAPRLLVNRVRNHGGPVLAAMHLQIVYIGGPSEGGSPNRDDMLKYIVGSGSSYWGILEQYGVGTGKVIGSTVIPRSDLIDAADIKAGIIDIDTLETRVATLLDPPAPATSIVPKAEAYAFFLPDGISVAVSKRGTKVFRTCVDVGAYHRDAGGHPYAVFPPCDQGRGPLAISHELAEMATDPTVGKGWLSDAEDAPGIGEIADLCNHEVSPKIGGYGLTQLWSNSDADCWPQLQ